MTLNNIQSINQSMLVRKSTYVKNIGKGNRYMHWTLLWRVLKNYPFVLPTGSDAPCLRAGGRCQHDSITCSGRYRTGLCSGGVRRRCCVPSSSNSGSFSTGKDDVTFNREQSYQKLK